jgi:hypothetical protein
MQAVSQIAAETLLELSSIIHRFKLDLDVRSRKRLAEIGEEESIFETLLDRLEDAINATSHNPKILETLLDIKIEVLAASKNAIGSGRWKFWITNNLLTSSSKEWIEKIHKLWVETNLAELRRTSECESESYSTSGGPDQGYKWWQKIIRFNDDNDTITCQSILSNGEWSDPIQIDLKEREALLWLTNSQQGFTRWQLGESRYKAIVRAKKRDPLIDAIVKSPKLGGQQRAGANRYRLAPPA